MAFKYIYMCVAWEHGIEKQMEMKSILNVRHSCVCLIKLHHIYNKYMYIETKETNVKREIGGRGRMIELKREEKERKRERASKQANKRALFFSFFG